MSSLRHHAVRLFVLSIVLAAAPLARAADDARTAELERKVDAISAELEEMRMGGSVADTGAAPTARLGLAPGAAKVYGAARGTSIGGYGEMLFTKPDRQREDDALSGGTNQLDLLRAVLYVGHKFNDDLLFNAEFEWEHAGVGDEAEAEVDPLTGEGEAELSGEAVVEFAYLDWRLEPWLGLRGGKLLVPMGLVNEMHEPPVFIGARRPDVEDVIIPSTWSAGGVGVYGETESGLAWRAYVMEGLNAEHFSPDEPIRGGRQGGSQASTTHPSFAGRVEWSGLGGLLIGVAGVTGDAWQDAQPAGEQIRARTTLVQAHARWNARGLRASGLFARGSIDGAEELSAALGLTGSEQLADHFWGGYLEAGYDVMPLISSGSRLGLIPYVRYEEYDTQDGDLPGGAAEEKAFNNTVLTVGAMIKPHPDVALKIDRQQRGNDAETATSGWNASLGWLF